MTVAERTANEAGEGARSCTIMLPFPPSENTLFTNRCGGRAKTGRYGWWINEAGVELLRQRPVRFDVPVQLGLELNLPDKRRRDIGNYLKPVADLLVRHQVIQDDSWQWIRRVTIGLAEGFDGARVTVTEWQGAAA